jgi:dephospho-CoA kinase
MARVIGLTGFANSGKDTIVEILRKEYPVRSVSLSTPLYLMLAALHKYRVFGPRASFTLTPEFDEALIRERIAQSALPYSKASNRVALQTLGDWARTVLGKQTLINLADEAIANAITSAQDENTLVVLSNVRYLDEARLVRLWHGRVWAVTRPQLEPSAEEMKTIHSTEREVPTVKGVADAHVTNDSTISVLSEKVLKLAKSELRTQTRSYRA